eukprot:232519-Chlamydomonas_euryale.AAC.2
MRDQQARERQQARLLVKRADWIKNQLAAAAAAAAAAVVLQQQALDARRPTGSKEVPEHTLRCGKGGVLWAAIGPLRWLRNGTAALCAAGKHSWVCL